MKTIKEAAKEFEKINGENIFYNATENPDTKLSIESFKAVVEFAERWIPMNELKEAGVEYLFKTSTGKHSVGKFEFIEDKLCITTDISYSLVEDSGFTHFRPINHK